MQKFLTVFSFALISYCAVAADAPDNTANGFIKADFQREISVPALTRLLGTGGGYLFVANESGGVEILTAEGKRAYSLVARSGETRLLKRPEEAAVADDIVYIADSGTDQVVQYALADGKYLGRFGAGTGGFFGRDGQNLNAPRGLAVYEGVIYVADSGNRRIQLFGINGVFLDTLALSAPPPARGENEKPYKLQKPSDIALDEAGHIYVLDGGDNLVKMYDADGNYLRAFAEIASPVALTVADDGVYIADERSQTISKFDFDGKLAYTFGSRGEGKSQTKKIAGLSGAKGQQVYIGDAGRALVNLFKTTAGIRIEPVPRAAGRASVKSIAGIEVEVRALAADRKGAVYGLGAGEKDGAKLVRMQDGKVAAEIRLKGMQPVALTLDAAGGIWVADEQKKRVVKLDENGAELLSVGSSGSGAGQFSHPAALAVASSGLLFVADRGNRSVQVFRSDGVFLKKLGGDKVKIERPVALGLDPEDRLFVLDAERGSVSVFSAGGEFMHEFGRQKEGSVFSRALDMAVTPDEVLVLDGNQVKAFDHRGRLLRVFGAKATGTATLRDPVALAMSKGSTLFLADTAAKRVAVLSVLHKPQAPQKILARNGVHAIDLQWAQPAVSYIKSFRVYRSGMEDGGYVRVATTETNRYRDEDLEPGKTYFYRVVALSDKGFEGASSAAVHAVPDKYLPPAPTAVQVETGPWQAKLSWAAAEPKYFAAYRIYQKERESFVKIGEVGVPAFVKDGLTPETAYTFHVSVLSRDDTESEKVAVEVKTEVFNRPPLEIEVVSLRDVFSNSYKQYESDGVGVIRLTNNTDRKMEKIHVSFLLKNFMDFATESKVAQLLPGQSEEVPLKAVFNNGILTLTEDSAVQVLIEASYFDNGKRETYSRNATVNVYDKHRLTWDERERFSVFVTPKDEPVLKLARLIVSEYKETKDEAQLAAALFDALGVFGLTWIQDPTNPYQITSGKVHTVDYLQFPRETLERKSGDCDDLVALYAAGLESMGIVTRVLEVPGHMLMMFDTGIPADSDGYTMNNLYAIHEGTLWIPVETTLVGSSFVKAWEKGSETYYKFRDNGLTILDIHGAWEKFKPASLPASDWQASGLTRAIIEKNHPGDVLSVLKISSQIQTRRYLDRLKTKPNDLDAHLQIGIILGKIGDRKEAMKYFDKVISLDAKNAAALNNRGNLLMIESKYQEAADAYRAAAKASPGDALILVNLTLAYKRMGQTKNAKSTFLQAKKLDPSVAVQYRALAQELLNAL